jgi:hypothetical protein
VIVLKKMLREAGDRPLFKTEGWAVNVELLGLAAPHARRIEEAPLQLRYHLHTRPSRVRPLRILRDLLGVRGTTWPVIGSENVA